MRVVPGVVVRARAEYRSVHARQRVGRGGLANACQHGALRLPHQTHGRRVDLVEGVGRQAQRRAIAGFGQGIQLPAGAAYHDIAAGQINAAGQVQTEKGQRADGVVVEVALNLGKRLATEKTCQARPGDHRGPGDHAPPQQLATGHWFPVAFQVAQRVRIKILLETWFCSSHLHISKILQ